MHLGGVGGFKGGAALEETQEDTEGPVSLPFAKVSLVHGTSERGLSRVGPVTVDVFCEAL